MAGMLFELKPTDPWAYVLVSLVLAAVAAGGELPPGPPGRKDRPDRGPENGVEQG